MSEYGRRAADKALDLVNTYCQDAMIHRRGPNEKKLIENIAYALTRSAARQSSEKREAVIEAAQAWAKHRDYLKRRYTTGDQISEADFDEADRLIQLLGAAVAALLDAEKGSK